MPGNGAVQPPVRCRCRSTQPSAMPVLRALGNRLVGILHGCLASHTTYNEATAWAHRTSQQITRAA